MALALYLSPRLSTIHISACNRKGFEEVNADVYEVVVTKAPTGYYEVVGYYINGRKVTFTHIKFVACQVKDERAGEPKFERYCRTPFRVRAHIGAFELEVTRCSE